jgi:hypothetical protein
VSEAATAVTSRRRAWYLGAGALGLMVLWLLVAGAAPPPPYSPYSTGAGGAKALEILLGRLGDSEQLSGPLPAPGRALALLLYDQLDGAARSEISAWVKRGGTLVVADPASPLEGAALAQGLPDQALTTSSPLSPLCPARWARNVELVGGGPPTGLPLLDAPPGSEACFPYGAGAFAVARREGAGVVVSMASASIWSNADLGRYDNALLAADLLAPGRGYKVTWLTVPWVAGGHGTLWSLVPSRVKLCLAGVALAVLAACSWRGRRLGRPVPEQPLVPVPGAELVAATGHLFARNRARQEAAGILRADLARQLAGRLGQAPGTPAATVAKVVAQHTGLSSEKVAWALEGPPPRDEAELVRISQAVQEVAASLRPAAPGRPGGEDWAPNKQ